MKNTILLLKRDFESSCGLTPEFAHFYKTFKKEFTEELMSVGAGDIQMSRGHFYVSGFFTKDGQPYFFCLPDVRWESYKTSHQLLYRKVKDYKDFTGEYNQYVTIEPGMAMRMNWR